MTLVERRKREKEQRCNDIINAAEKLFFSRGFDNVSMDEIANEAEINKALLYYYFNSKDSLFFAVVLRGLRIMYGMLEERTLTPGSGIERMISGGEVYTEFAMKYPDYFQAYNYVLSGRFDLAGDNENLKEIMEIRSSTFGITCDLIRDGMDDDTIRPDVCPIEVAMLMSIVFDGFSKLAPNHMKILSEHGIDRYRFMKDIRDLLHIAIENKKEDDHD